MTWSLKYVKKFSFWELISYTSVVWTFWCFFLASLWNLSTLEKLSCLNVAAGHYWWRCEWGQNWPLDPGGGHPANTQTPHTLCKKGNVIKERRTGKCAAAIIKFWLRADLAQIICQRSSDAFGKEKASSRIIWHSLHWTLALWNGAQNHKKMLNPWPLGVSGTIFRWPSSYGRVWLICWSPI